MKRTTEDFDRLLAELDSDVTDLRSVHEMNIRAEARLSTGGRDQLDYAALGYTIHNTYGVIEAYCLRVAKFFENGLDPASWHKELLRRLTLEIEHVRPALLDRDTWLILDEVRSFRHAFRHLYARPIDPSRVDLVQRRIPDAVSLFIAAHTRFRSLLVTIRDRLESE